MYTHKHTHCQWMGGRVGDCALLNPYWHERNNTLTFCTTDCTMTAACLGNIEVPDACWYFMIFYFYVAINGTNCWCDVRLSQIQFYQLCLARTLIRTNWKNWAWLSFFFFLQLLSPHFMDQNGNAVGVLWERANDSSKCHTGLLIENGFAIITWKLFFHSLFFDLVHKIWSPND